MAPSSDRHQRTTTFVFGDNGFGGWQGLSPLEKYKRRKGELDDITYVKFNSYYDLCRTPMRHQSSYLSLGWRKIDGAKDMGKWIQSKGYKYETTAPYKT
jgi:hypothetical protein